MKILFKWIKWLLFVAVLIITASYVFVELNTSGLLYSVTDSIPENEVGLLLGTSKYMIGGGNNPYYEYRIEACAELFRRGKIKFIIVSGDNRKANYNEPAQMRDDLIKLGVKSKCIFLDYAGLRTLDSVVRSKEIFGQISITIISQAFHNKRAIFIANAKGIQAIGFNARDVDALYGLKVQIREVFARVKLMIDLYIINKQPKYLGKRVIIS